MLLDQKQRNWTSKFLKRRFSALLGLQVGVLSEISTQFGSNQKTSLVDSKSDL